MAEAPRRALVLGGTGTIGRHVVRGLVAAGVVTDFTWHGNEAVADGLDANGHRLDFTDIERVRAWAEGQPPPQILVHCAAAVGPAELAEVTPAEWTRIQAINCQAPFAICQALTPRMDGGNIVFVGALDRGQTLPLPVAFAGTQGMLGAMVMALGKELGPRGIAVNLVTSGLLGQGISESIPEELHASFLTYSAMRRTGKPEEVARGILWLALNNTYMSGRSLPIQGGI